jgi:hypothetical protein
MLLAHTDASCPGLDSCAAHVVVALQLGQSSDLAKKLPRYSFSKPDPDMWPTISLELSTAVNTGKPTMAERNIVQKQAQLEQASA